MTPSRVVRALSLFLLLAAVPTLALAGTTEFRVFFDVDSDATTGCTVGDFDGVEQVLVTQVTDDDTTPRVTRTHRQICAGGILGGATDVVTSGWPAAWRSADRMLTLETRIPFSSFGTGMPESLHVGFDATRGAAVHAALTNSDGTPVTVPGNPVRRRAVGERPGRTIVLDGALADWGAIDPVLFGIPGGGTKALRLLRILSFANTTDSHVYFAAQLHISSEAPFADEDEYLRTPGEQASIPAGAGVLKNDGDPNGLPLTATKVSEAARGTVTLNPDGSFTYSPNNPASHLTDEFEYKATNGTKESNVARVRIKVDLGEDPEGPPVDDLYATDEDKTLTVAAPGVLENDPGKQNLVAALVTPPTRGTVVLNPDGGFTYKPNLNFFGEDSFVYSATRTTSGKPVGNATVTIEVERVNDAPSFTSGGNVTRQSNAGPYSQIWATNISAGAPNESGQTLTFVVTNNNNSLFSVQPSISPNGTLSFTPTGALGQATVTVVLQDNGGVANGGDNTSDPVTFTITITCGGITVTSPAANTATVGTAFSGTFTQSGASGTATFTTSSTLPAGMSLSTSGVLSGTPTQSGSFPISVTVTDSNGCTGTSNPYTLVVSCQTITVTNPATNTGTAGSPFSQTFTQSGALGGATFTTNSTLPAGLTLAPNGTLSGTPTQTGTFPIVVTVTDGNGCTGTSSTYNLTINCQTITVTNPATNTGTAGTPFSQTFTQSGAIGTATFSTASVLPAGLVLGANGNLAGTPTQTGTFPIVVTVTDGNGCTGTSSTYTLTINCQTITVNNPATNTGTAGAPFSATFTSSNGIAPITYTLASGTLPAGVTLASNGVLSGTPTVTGSFPITVTATDANGCTGTGATYTLTINCQTITVTNPANTTGTVNAPFSEQFTQSGAIGSATFSTASPLPNGLTLSPAGLLSGTPTQQGTFPITVTVTDANGCTGIGATYTLVIGCQTITVTNPSNATGPAGSPFSETFTQTGAVGTATFTLASGTLPAGMTLAANGVLSGTPTQNGTFPITVTVTDSNGCTGTGTTYNLTITCQTITVTNPSNGNGTANSAFSETFTQTGALGSSTFSLASGTLPAGLTLAANGVLSGTPTQTGSFPITVRVTDANGCTGTGPTYTIVIACQTITVNNPANANGTANSAFSETFTQTGAIGTPTFSLDSGTLPAGLTLAPNGVLSGTPTVIGSFPITVKVTDANNCSGASATYTIVIACQTITVNNPANANGTANSAFSETFTQTNGIGTITYTLASGTLPAGLTLASNGVLSGTPTQTGSFPITVTATDANGCTGTGATYTIVIGCQTITVTNPSNAAGTAGSPFSETFTQTGAIGTATFTLGSGTLPAGLTLAANGVLSGTPTQTGSFPITVTVTDANGCTGTSATSTIVIGCQTITVTNPSNATGPAGSPFSETFTQTGAIGTATFTLASGTLPAGLTLAPNGVLSGTPTQGGSFPITVTVTDANGCTGTGGTYTIVITCPVITVTNPSNANGTANSPFSETFSQTGGQGTVTWTLASGTLPAGLTLAPNGVLSGTPTQTGSFPITVTATDANGCTGTSSTYTIVIACQAITVTNPANGNGTANSAFSETFTSSNGIGTMTYTLASGTLPAGLSLAPNGVLSGTPTQTGSFPITVTATDANGCTGTGATYTLVIGCQTITVNNPANANATINAPFSETFTQTGAIGTATFTTASTLPNGITLAANGVLSGTPTQTGTFPITVTVTDANGCTGTSATYNLVVACQTITVTNPSNANGTVGTLFSETFTQSGVLGTPSYSTSSTLPAGLTLNAATGVLSGTPTQAGNFPITVTVTDSSNGCTGTSSTYNLVIACQTITVTNPSNANGTVGSPFSETFTQTGAIGTVTWSTASTLPAGITLNSATGVLSGTPTEDGTFPIVVTATDANGCTGTSSTYNLTIVCQTITVNNPANSNGTVDAAFSETFTNTGAIGAVTYTLASGTLPSGLTLAANGVLSGTPGQPGNFPITVMVTDANGCTGTSGTYTLVIACQTITVTNPGVSTAVYNQAFSQTFTQTGVGTHTPAVWSLASGTLPAGITLNTSTGVLSGTPTQTGTFPITVKVTDVNNCAGTGATYNLTVAPVAVADSYSNAVNNTQFVLTGGATATPSTPAIQIAGTIEANDFPSAATVTVTAETKSTTNGGSVTINSDGTFLYTPPAQPGVAPPPSDTFTYTVSSDTGATGTPVTSAPATVTVNLTNRVWYVKNDAAAGGDGRSHQPFDTLAEAQTASTANDIIYVYTGNGTTTGQNSGFVMKNGQKLWGQGIALVVNSQTLVGAGSQPQIGNSAGTGVSITNLSGIEVRGLNIAGTADGIGAVLNVASTVTLNISNNTIRSAGNEGIDIDASAGVYQVALSDTSAVATGTAIDVAESASGQIVITAFDDLTIGGTTAATGINVAGATFDATPGGGYNLVAGGALNVGTPGGGNGAGTNGLLFTNVSGDLGFTNFNVFADNGTAVGVSGSSSAFNAATPAGFRLTANAGTDLISAVNGPAVNISASNIVLAPASITSTGTTTFGFNLDNVSGSYSSGGSISGIGSAAATAFRVNGSSVSTTYTGTISANQGKGVDLTTNSGTYNFTGALTLNTGANTAFNANASGTVSSSNTSSTLQTTTAVALNVANTNIGASHLQFTSINVNGAANGIVVNNTGNAGGVRVHGSGTTDGSGGTIQNTSGRGASFITASNVLLKNMNFTNTATTDPVPANTGLSLGTNTADAAAIHLQVVTAAELDNINITGSSEHGINGHNVNGFALKNSVISGTGNAADEDGIHFYNMLGGSEISNTTISGSGDDNANIQNNTNLALPAGFTAVTNLTVSNSAFNTGGLGSGLLFGIRGSSNATLNISGVTANNNFSGGIVADAFDTSTMIIDVGSSTLTNNNDGIQVSSNQTANVQYDIHDNANISGNDFLGITIIKAAFSGAATLQGAIRNNSVSIANGRPTDAIFVNQAGAGTLRTLIDNNNISYAGTQRAILLQAGTDGAGALEATVTNNDIDIQLDGAGNAVAGILAQVAVTSPQGDGSSMCVDIGGAGVANVFTHSLGGSMAGGDIRVRQRNNGTVRLPGYAGAATDPANSPNHVAVQNYLNARNTVVSPSTATWDNTGFAGGAACAAPTIP